MAEKETRKVLVATGPSIAQTVETCSWLSEVLRGDLEEDLASDEELRNADIE